jgi:hypothetical protein
MLVRSSRFELHHPAGLSAFPFHSSPLFLFSNKPLRPLLVQHSVSTLLATNRISLLQLHLARAVAAEILCCRAAVERGGEGATADWGVEGGRGGRGDVGFAGHGGGGGGI